MTKRVQYREIPNVIGYSLFSRSMEGKRGSFMTLVENSMNKDSESRWTTVWKDFLARRDMASYLKLRWNFN